MKKLATTVGILLIVLAAALLISPGLALAQTHTGGKGQPETKKANMQGKMRMMQTNMGMLGQVTTKIYQVISKDNMSPEQKKEVLNIMEQMSQMMEEMSVPHGEEVKKRHYRELQEMRKRVDTL
jgi:hypothetical protein